MQLGHATALAEARSHLAALADQAPSIDASIGYENVLLRLDALSGDLTPGITPIPPGDRRLLFETAHAAIEKLAPHGVDLLAVELLLDGLEAVRSLDLPQDPG